MIVRRIRTLRWWMREHFWLVVAALGMSLALAGGVVLAMFPVRFRSRPFQFPEGSPTVIREAPFHGQVHFNNTPGDLIFETLMQKRIDGSLSSVKIAMYSFSLKSIHERLQSAFDAGKSVGLVVDGQRNADLVKTLELDDAPEYSIAYPMTNDSSRMHHKFAVTDEGTGGATAFIGSCNLTRQQTGYDPGAFIEIRDRMIADALAAEFERIRRGTRGRAKLQDPTYRPRACTVQHGDQHAELWLSPGFGTNSFKQRLIELVSSATSTIDIAIWKFADLELAKLLVAKAKSGVRVRLIIDGRSGISGMDVFGCLTGHSEIQLKAGLQLASEAETEDDQNDGPPPGMRPFIHHHTIIVDDRVIAFGSSNWSFAGFYQNDEANLVTDVDWIVEPFTQTFALFDRNTTEMTEEMMQTLRLSILQERVR